MIDNQEVQNIEIYLDYATIPSLNYFLHFAENKDDKETIRLFGLSRFTVPDKLISSFPDDIIKFFPIKGHNQTLLNDAFHKLLKESKTEINLNFHLNLFHSFNMFMPFLNIYIHYLSKIKSIKLNLYDDGAEGIVCLYDLAHSNIDIKESVNFHKLALENMLKTKKLNVNNLSILRYLWNTCYPTQYTLLKKDYLEKTDKLIPLKNNLSNKYSEMNWNRFLSLSEEQKDIVLSFFNISESLKELLFNLMNSKRKIFLFVGTTIYQKIDLDLEIVHKNALESYLNPESQYYIGDEYVVCYKGHPNSSDVNLKIEQEFKNIIFLPESVPIEILLLLGFIPKKVGGFSSTTFLFLDKEIIHNIIFITEKESGNKNLLFETQSHFAKLMIELDYIESSKISYYQEFIK